MANSKELFVELTNKVSLNESKEEIESIVYLVLENTFGLSRTMVMTGVNLPVIDKALLAGIVDRVNREEPIQYVLGEAWFYGRKFLVNSSVLIPRPETEQIVSRLLDHVIPAQRPGAILDIGTGSGCLAITFAKELPAWKIYATDLSDAALKTAAGNAKFLHADVRFFHHDILQGNFPVTGFDFVVSNPPYIAMSERSSMRKNVLDHEPAEALFVSDDDPLIFYKALAREGQRILTPGGRMIVEINGRFGNEVAALFRYEGYAPVSIIKDIDSKDRIVSAVRV